MPHKIIYISGLGADKRAFVKLKINGDHQHVYAEWISLKDENESFESYCTRLIETYDINPEDALIGLSFGGFIAQYIAKELGNNKVVLVSSFRNKSDLRPLMIFGLKYKLYKALPSRRVPVLTEYFALLLNSINKESRKAVKDMLKPINFIFMNWAIRHIDNIDLSDSYSPDYLSFTGTSDKLVSNWIGPNHVTINNGSHFMIYERAHEISSKINHYINS